MRLLGICTRTIFSGRCSWWPFVWEIFEALNAMQGRMIGVLLGGHPLAGQDTTGWYLARARKAQAIARDWG
eukprot:6602759-Karenia_brevis.AAC.1